MKHLGAHNALTGYPVRKWWMIPFNVMAQCQDLKIQKLYDCGVRYYDIRVRKVNGKWMAAHGIVEYDITLDEALTQIELSDLFEKGWPGVYVSVTLENWRDKGSSRYLDDDFVNTVEQEIKKHTYVKLVNINRKKPTWTVLRSYNPLPLSEKYEEGYGIGKLPNPKKYAVRNNSRYKSEQEEDTFLTLDFVEK